jgi:hypothetical protein
MSSVVYFAKLRAIRRDLPFENSLSPDQHVSWVSSASVQWTIVCSHLCMIGINITGQQYVQYKQWQTMEKEKPGIPKVITAQNNDQLLVSVTFFTMFGYS